MSHDHRDVRVIQQIKGHASDVTTCDFASNYTLITGSGDKTVRIWDWTAGQGYVERENSPLREHKYNVTCVQASPQGFMFASASVDGTAILWNVNSLTKIYTMTQVNGDAIRVCRFAPDSTIFVTAGDNGAICIWDLARRGLIRTIHEHEGTTQSLSFTPDSLYLISACSLEILNVWYVHDLVDTMNESLCTPSATMQNAMDMGVLTVDVSKRIEIDENNPLEKIYTLATGGSANEIKVWTLRSEFFPKQKGSVQRVNITCDKILAGHCSSVTCLKYNADGSFLVSSSLDRTIKIWDNSGNCTAQLKGHTRYVNCISISKDSTIVASGSNDRHIMIWDLNGNLTVDSELVKRRDCENAEYHPELHVVQNPDCVEIMEKLEDAAEGSVNCTCFYDNNCLAIGCGDKNVKLFGFGDNSNLIELPQSPLEGHTYAVNYLDVFKDGTKLSTCSQDGCTFIWNPQTGEKIATLPTSSLSIRVCRFSSDGKYLVTAGDDEKVNVWKVDTLERLTTLEGHLDAITCACFSPDCTLLATSCFNEDFRLWNCNENFRTVHVQEDVHTTGIQSCDFSPNLEPIPNANALDQQTYLLATCGNDNVAKLWCVTILKLETSLDYDSIKVKIWRTLYGHGGSLTCVKFSPCSGEIVCSTATDRQARLWSVYSGDCLYVLDHDSIVTTCSFSANCKLIATGCIDKSLWVWKLPSQLVFQTSVENKMKYLSKNLMDWRVFDVIGWLETVGLSEFKTNVLNANLDGQKIISFSEDEICSALDISDEKTELFAKEIKWLKQDDRRILNLKRDDVPFDFLCPITHEIMMEPVICSDGFTYERRAIAEWFMAGKYTSPMTNEPLTTTSYKLNNELRNAIHDYLDLDAD